MSEKFTLGTLHDYPHYISDCCILLNNQWPRSETARLRSIKHSNNDLPASIILFNSETKELVGHAKISRHPQDSKACWIESVIISPSLRGNGLGRMLMTGCESFAAKKGFHIIYLSTHDKEKFYAFLGYELCEAIHFYGGRPSLKPQKSLDKKTSISPKCNSSIEKNQTCSSVTTLPPPPPPLPGPDLLGGSCPKKYMMKTIRQQ